MLMLVEFADGVLTGIAIGSRARALGPRGSDRSGPFMYNIYVVGMNARPDDHRLHTPGSRVTRLIPSTTVTPREADYSDYHAFYMAF